MNGKDWDDPLHILMDRARCIGDAKQLVHLLQDAKQAALDLGQNELAANIRELLVGFAKKPLREIVERQEEARAEWEYRQAASRPAASEEQGEQSKGASDDDH